MTDERFRDLPAVWLLEAVDTEEAARMANLSPATLATWRSRGGGPKFRKLGHKTVRYIRIDVLEWMQNNGRDNTTARSPATETSSATSDR